MDNVIPLPRPPQMRSNQDGLGFFVRVGRNDHKEVLELIAAGERGIFGFVIEAQNVERHRTLITEARKRDFDVILDPKTQQMGMPGSYNDSLRVLPWARSNGHHSVADFDGEAGKSRALQVVEFAKENGFTQVMGPSHLITDPNDPWLQRDVASMVSAAESIQRSGAKLELVYSLAVPMEALRDDSRRSAIFAVIARAPCNSIWLKVENFGDDASGEKTVAYIKACQELHPRGVPLIADHVGGLSGLGTLAFGAVGGIAHGVTINQGFSASNWRRPPRKGGGNTERRVYLPQLDMLVNHEAAKKFLTSSQRVRSRHVCRDSHCCARGLSDMLDRPARHALYQRSRKVETLSAAPKSVRTSSYLDNVRRISDDVARAASFDKLDAEFRKKLLRQQKRLGHFRDAMAHLASVTQDRSFAIAPRRRSAATP
jgi:hypothetical protein